MIFQFISIIIGIAPFIQQIKWSKVKNANLQMLFATVIISLEFQDFSQGLNFELVALQ